MNAEDHPNQSDPPEPIPIRHLHFLVSRRVEIMASVLLVSAAALVPWTVFLGLSLPGKYDAGHWSLLWTGFDVVLLSSLRMPAGLRGSAARFWPQLRSLLGPCSFAMHGSTSSRRLATVTNGFPYSPDSGPRSRWRCFFCGSIGTSSSGPLRHSICGWTKAHRLADFEMPRSCTFVDQTKRRHAKSNLDRFMSRSESIFARPPPWSHEEECFAAVSEAAAALLRLTAWMARIERTGHALTPRGVECWLLRHTR